MRPRLPPRPGSRRREGLKPRDSQRRRLPDEAGDLLGQLVRAPDHHAVQRGRVLGDVDADGPDLEHGSGVGLQPPLGAVQGLGLGDAALHHGSSEKGGRS